MLLTNRVAVITGGASGVGREAAKLFAQEGASIVIGDVLEDAAAETVRMVKDLGGRIAYAPTDVTQEASVKSLMHQAVASFGGLDIVLNNAGVPSPNPPKDTWEFTDADYDRLMDTNLRGVFYGCKHAIPLLIQRGGGVIVNMASASGLVSWGSAMYGVSKAGVIHLTKGLAVETAPYNIRVNCVCPGPIDTEFGTRTMHLTPEEAASRQARLGQTVPWGRMSRPEEIAKAALYLASDMSSYVTGTSLVIDGGHTAR